MNQQEWDEKGRYAQWKAKHGLSESSAIKALSTVARRKVVSSGHRGRYYADWRYLPISIQWSNLFDHVDVFLNPRRHSRVLTLQPYPYPSMDSDIAALRAFCADHGMTVSVFPDEGWHAPGLPLVVIERASGRKL